MIVTVFFLGFFLGVYAGIKLSQWIINSPDEFD